MYSSRIIRRPGPFSGPLSIASISGPDCARAASSSFAVPVGVQALPVRGDLAAQPLLARALLAPEPQGLGDLASPCPLGVLAPAEVRLAP